MDFKLSCYVKTQGFDQNIQIENNGLKRISDSRCHFRIGFPCIRSSFEYWNITSTPAYQWVKDFRKFWKMQEFATKRIGYRVNKRFISIENFIMKYFVLIFRHVTRKTYWRKKFADIKEGTRKDILTRIQWIPHN